MARRSRKDDNEDEVRAALERIGCTVYPMGRPVDLLVGYRGKTFCIEVKGENTPFTPFQKKWIPAWRGHVAVVRSADEAIAEVT